jgi:hypothetical protein
MNTPCSPIREIKKRKIRESICIVEEEIFEFTVSKTNNNRCTGGMYVEQ